MGVVKKLPPVDPQKSRKTLVLDLIGTLFHISGEAAIPMTHRLYADSCVLKHPNSVFMKDLNLLYRDLSKLILIDDKRYYTNQCENGFPVSVFKGNKNDRMLFQLIEFCKRVADRSTDIREDIASYPLSVYNNCLLPPVAHNKFTLVLELKGVVADINPFFQKGEFRVQFGFEGEMHTAFVSKRPGLNKFLEELQGLYEIVVFTESNRSNASALLDKIDPEQKLIPLTHRLFRNSCTKILGGFVKDLSKLGRDMKKVIYVDVWPCGSLQPKNSLTVDSFSRDMQVMDSALLPLMDFCSHVAESRPFDVRTLFVAEKDKNEKQNIDENLFWLPPMEGNYTRTVVFNLKGTIIQSSTSELPRYDFTVELESFHGKQTCYVLKRPGLEQLLSKLPDLGYEIVIFTSTGKSFVEAVLEKLDNIIPLTHRLYRRHCRKLPNSVLIKDLSMLGRDLSKLILVDDRPYFSYQSENAYPLCEFNGDTKDRVLFELMGFCKHLVKSTAPSDRDIREELLSYTLMLSSLNLHRQLLPPMEKSDRKMNKKTLVLDLDETLIHSAQTPHKRYDFTIEIWHRNSSYTYYVLKRPGVDKLLDELRSLYEIVVFTASNKEYADPILNKLDPHRNIIRHRLYRDSCTQLPGPKHVKDLSRLGRSLSKVIFVDDRYRHHYQQENAFPVGKFLDDMNDTELLSLLDFCKRVANSRSDARTHILSHATNLNK